MSLETATYLDSLVSSNPGGADALSTADDHLRLLKACLQRTFPNITGAVTATHSNLNDAANGAITVSYAASADYAVSAAYAVSADHALSADTAFALSGLVEYYGVTTADNTQSAMVGTVSADVTFTDITLTGSVWYELDAMYRFNLGLMYPRFNYQFANAPQAGEVVYQSTQTNGGFGATGVHSIGGADSTVSDDSAEVITMRGSFLTHASGGVVAFAFGQSSVGALSTNEDIELLAGSTLRLRKLS